MRNNTKKDFRNEFRKSLIPSSISLLAFSGLLHRFLGVFAQIKNTDVAETHTCTMTAEANIAILVEKSGVVFVVHGIRIVFSSVWSYVVSLASLANVAIGNNFSVHGNGKRSLARSALCSRGRCTDGQLYLGRLHAACDHDRDELPYLGGVLQQILPCGRRDQI